MKPISELLTILNLPKIPQIPRGITKRDYKEYLRLSSLKRQTIKQRKKILSKYKVSNIIDHDKDGYSKSSVYLYKGQYYN